MGLLDLFGGGYSTDPNAARGNAGSATGGGLLGGGSDLYGDVLTPEQKRAVQQRKLAGFSAAIAPYLGYSTDPGKVGSFLQVLNAGLGGMGQEEDAAALNALRASQLGLNTKTLQQKQSFLDMLTGAMSGKPADQTAAPQPGAGVVPQVQPQVQPGAGMSAGGAGVSANGPAMAARSGSPVPQGAVGGGSASTDWLNQNAPFPTLARPQARPVSYTSAVPDMASLASDPASYGPGSPFGRTPPAQLAQAGSIQPGILPGGQAPQQQAAPAGGVMAPGGMSGAPAPQSAPAGSASPQTPMLGSIPLTNENVLRMGILGDMMGIPSLGTLLTNTPSYQGSLEAARKWAGVPASLYEKRNSPDVDPAVQQRLAAAKTIGEKQGVLQAAGINPASPQGQQILGATAAHAAGIEPFLGGTRANVPLLQYNPQTGGYAVAQPPGYAEAAAGLAANTAGGSELGKARVEYNPLNTQQPGQPVPQAPAGQPGTPAGQAQQMQGSPLAPGIVSTIPPIREPNLSPAELHAAVPKWIEASNELPGAKDAAQQAEHRLLNIADAFKMVQSGSFLTQKADFDALLKSIGVRPILTNDPAAVQLALHENYRATLQNLGAVNKRFTQNEFRVMSENSEHPNLQPEANLNMLAEDIGSLRQVQSLASDWRAAQMAGAHNIDAFRTDWLNANPLSKVSEAVKQEIGPLKGMSGAAGSPGAVSTPYGTIRQVR